jgi:hypothetical protein
MTIVLVSDQLTRLALDPVAAGGQVTPPATGLARSCALRAEAPADTLRMPASDPKTLE